MKPTGVLVLALLLSAATVNAGETYGTITGGSKPVAPGVKMEIRVAGKVETSSVEFWTDFFDFPMIDNTRLEHDQRCAVILNAFENGSADITVAYFPGSYASLNEKPYYQEVVQNLMRSNQMLDQQKAER